jgi:hypothetical protein
MCVVTANDRMVLGDDEPYRSCPRLAWTVPVSINTIGANLEAYSIVDYRMRFLRLAQRFRSGPLSRMPFEIMEMMYVIPRYEVR